MLPCTLFLVCVSVTFGDSVTPNYQAYTNTPTLLQSEVAVGTSANVLGTSISNALNYTCCSWIKIPSGIDLKALFMTKLTDISIPTYLRKLFIFYNISNFINHSRSHKITTIQQ